MTNSGDKSADGSGDVSGKVSSENPGDQKNEGEIDFDAVAKNHHICPHCGSTMRVEKAELQCWDLSCFFSRRITPADSVPQKPRGRRFDPKKRKATHVVQGAKRRKLTSKDDVSEQHMGTKKGAEEAKKGPEEVVGDDAEEYVNEEVVAEQPNDDDEDYDAKDDYDYGDSWLRQLDDD